MAPAHKRGPLTVGINHVALEVDDVERAITFYGRLFERRQHAAQPSTPCFNDPRRPCRSPRLLARDSPVAARVVPRQLDPQMRSEEPQQRHERSAIAGLSLYRGDRI